MIYTFQDFEKSTDKATFLRVAINNHDQSDMVKIALDADTYAAQENSTIMRFVPTYYNLVGEKKVDLTKSNHHIACNFFDYLNSQRCNYSLGNGLQFEDENVIDKLGDDFSTTLSQAGYYALIHGESFLFWSGEKMYMFKITEFVPLVDEETSALRAGIRYWQLDKDHPQMAVLYEEDGYTIYKSETNRGTFNVYKDKRSYRVKVKKTQADPEPEVIGEDNWGTLPIFPFWGTRKHKSTLVGMKGAIDAYDLGKSGFANSMDNLNELLTVISNANGMDETDLLFVQRWLKTQGIISADEGSINTVNRTVDYAARQAFLAELREGIFADFGGLDVHTIMAGGTNDHIAAAYEPLNAAADDFEDQITKAVRPFLKMIGIDESPSFKRRSIANESQYNAMILQAATYLNHETILRKLTFIDNDEVKEILESIEKQEQEKFEQQIALAQEQAKASAGATPTDGEEVNTEETADESEDEEEEGDQ